MLEFLIQPQPKEGYGVFGGGWERPRNVFTAAESLRKQLKRQAATRQNQSTGRNRDVMTSVMKPAAYWLYVLTKIIVFSLQEEELLKKALPKLKLELMLVLR